MTTDISDATKTDDTTSFPALSLLAQTAQEAAKPGEALPGLAAVSDVVRHVSVTGLQGPDGKPIADTTFSGKGKKVVVTGADGYLGGYIVKKLLARNYTVIGTVRDPGNMDRCGFLLKLPNASSKLELVEAHLDRWGSYEGAIRGRQVDYVIHTAAPFFQKELTDYERDLVAPTFDGTLNVIDTCYKTSTVKRVILTSSMAAVMGAQKPPAADYVWTDKDWSDIETLRQRKAWYPLAKTKAERGAWQFVTITKPEPTFDLVVVNPTMMIGPMMHRRLNASMKFILDYLKGNRQRIPRTCMSFVGVEAAAEAHVLCLENLTASGRHLCAAASLTNDHIYSILQRACPKGPNLTRYEDGPQEPLTLYDTSKLRNMGLEFGSVVDDLVATVESLRQFGWLTDIEGPPPVLTSVDVGALITSDSQSPKNATSPKSGGRLTADALQVPTSRPAYLRHDVSTALIEEEELRMLFATFAVDRNGCISKKEFKEFYLALDNIGLVEEDTKIDDFISCCSSSNSDNMSFEEFAILMLKLAQR